MWKNLRITNFRPHERNTLRGFFEVTLDNGMTLKGCTYHEMGERRWIGLPSKQYTTEAGEPAWQPIVGFEEKRNAWSFSDACVKAIDEALGKSPKASDGWVNDFLNPPRGAATQRRERDARNP